MILYTCVCKMGYNLDIVFLITVSGVQKFQTYHSTGLMDLVDSGTAIAQKPQNLALFPEIGRETGRKHADFSDLVDFAPIIPIIYMAHKPRGPLNRPFF